jgi:putative transposase
MPRIARVVAVSYPHHITQRGNNRADVFFDDEDRAYYIKTLKKYCLKWRVKIWAYCLMSNHVHLLAVPASEESLAQCIGRTNLMYTQYANRKYQRSGRLWQNRFFSTIVEDKPYVWAVVRYIELNPVKAKQVQKPEDYPWSSCKANISGKVNELISGHTLMEEAERKAYRKFLQQTDVKTEQKIRQATSTGRPLGSEGFIKKLERKLSRRLLPGKAGRPQKTKSNLIREVSLY